MLKKLLITAALIILPAAAIAQMWSNLPILSGPSYCSATNNAVCTNTVPAGPSISGLETIPTDTNFASGAAGPQTVKAPITVLNSGKTVVSTNATGETVTVDAQTRQVILTPAGTIAALTVNLPAFSATGAPYSGQRIGICGTQIVSTLTMGAGTSNTFSTTAPTAMLVPVVTGAASCFDFIYVKAATAGVWHRTQ